MCGLIGQVGWSAVSLDHAGREAQLGLIAHRGPDGRGAWFSQSSNAPFFMGHTRLAIQDVTSASAQPYMHEHVALTYNGELWDAHAIDVGPRTTTGDTEVVAKSLARHGVDALDYFDGMFAVAWMDREQEALYLARDRWGKVPLYWATNGSSVAYASEYGALPRGWLSQPVPPGWVVRIPVTSGEPYAAISQWQWANDPMPAGWEPTPKDVRDLLRLGVAQRLAGQREIAYLLSGGLDSSLILALALEESDTEVVAYTAKMREDSADLHMARRVAYDFGVKLVEVPVPEPSRETVAAAVRAVEITALPAQVDIALAHLPLMQAISEDGYAVCLSGEAADELFGGYGNAQIQAAKLDDEGYRELKRRSVEKMARGNFVRVNKVGMRYGVECRLPFMQEELVRVALDATKDQSPPGKKLLKAAAEGLVPDYVIKRPKDTFQGGVGTSHAGYAVSGGIHPQTYYNQVAKSYFGTTFKA